MRIASVSSAFPPNWYSQETLLAALSAAWADRHFNLDRLEGLHRNVLVGGRHLALPIEEYAGLTTFGKANDAWIRVGEEVGAAAVSGALAAAGLGPADVDALTFVSVTGIAAPSLDARLMNRLGLPGRVRRTPIFGLGCVAGAAGLARVADTVLAHPDQVAVLLSVELCSLTLQREDLSVPNLVASGLFGDGAAAVVVVGADRPEPGPRIVASRSFFYPGTEGVMGWAISERGFRVVLTAEVPDMVRLHLRADVDTFLSENGLRRRDVPSWICHPGGPKVLQAMQEALEVPEEALALTWKTLREAGNLSSTSVLLVLEESMKDGNRPSPGTYGVVLALGPGFCSEMVLLEW